jgi:predicted transcriptional regulator
MNELEFALLDELYFIISFDELQKNIGWEKETLKEELKKLAEKKWIRCFKDTIEQSWDEIGLEKDMEKYHYLASKKGLLIHNQRNE